MGGLASRHPEDIKAELRKKFGSVFAFEDALKLPRKSVSDFLRGRPNQRVSDAIESILPSNDAGKLPADLSDNIADGTDAHRLNSAAS